MTTPNIKALAEKIKAEHEKNHDVAWSVGHEYYFEDHAEYLLACALLRVMEDANNVSASLKTLITPLTEGEARLDEWANAEKALESHNKLMEELNK